MPSSTWSTPLETAKSILRESSGVGPPVSAFSMSAPFIATLRSTDSSVPALTFETRYRRTGGATASGQMRSADRTSVFSALTSSFSAFGSALAPRRPLMRADRSGPLSVKPLIVTPSGPDRSAANSLDLDRLVAGGSPGPHGVAAAEGHAPRVASVGRRQSALQAELSSRPPSPPGIRGRAPSRPRPNGLRSSALLDGKATYPCRRSGPCPHCSRAASSAR